MKKWVQVMVTVLVCGASFFRHGQTAAEPQGAGGLRHEAGGGTSTPSRDYDRIIAELDRTDHRLRDLEAQRDEVSAGMVRIEEEYAKMLTRAGKTGRDGEGEGELSRLVALYKFKQMGYATPLLFARDPRSAVEAGQVASMLLTHDGEVLEDLRKRASEAGRESAALTRKREELDGMRRSKEALDREALALEGEKGRILDSIWQREDLNAIYSARIEETRRGLDERTRERESAEQNGALAFSSRHGSLPLPAAGEIIAVRGSKVHASGRTILYNSGIIIKTARGQPVRAIHDGRVVFADWLREYGKVMIIDHGDHYHSLIAHADQFFRREGDRVRGGETIASVGNTGSLEEPKLYFEIRYRGKPIDPMQWLTVRKSSRE